mmetsp:Transcript_2207/g.4955  ORF Transcript_2207/g.4955 Transcript_2207/m.4955 type:complete len:204 (-) Transcript_2207:24-635(-)
MLTLRSKLVDNRNPSMSAREALECRMSTQHPHTLGPGELPTPGPSTVSVLHSTSRLQRASLEAMHTRQASAFFLAWPHNKSPALAVSALTSASIASMFALASATTPYSVRALSAMLNESRRTASPCSHSARNALRAFTARGAGGVGNPTGILARRESQRASTLMASARSAGTRSASMNLLTHRDTDRQLAAHLSGKEGTHWTH